VCPGDVVVGADTRGGNEHVLLLEGRGEGVEESVIIVFLLGLDDFITLLPLDNPGRFGVGGPASALRLVTLHRVPESRVSHASGMTVADRLGQHRVTSHLLPVDLIQMSVFGQNMATCMPACVMVFEWGGQNSRP